MHPAVLTAVLLLMGILNTGTARPDTPPPEEMCAHYVDKPCGDGWSHIADDLCVKYFDTPKSFSDAEEHCNTLHADLVEVDSEEEMEELICFSWKINPELHKFWIGVQRSEEDKEMFVNKDGSEVAYSHWRDGQPDDFGGDEDCVETNFTEWGLWNDNICTKEKPFVCARKK